MIDRSEAWEIHKAKFAEYKRQFLEKEITEDVLRASLFGLGFHGPYLESEVNLIKMDVRYAGPKGLST